MLPPTFGRIPRHYGLDLLRQLVTLNNGCLAVFSHDARSIIAALEGRLTRDEDEFSADFGWLEFTLVQVTG